MANVPLDGQILGRTEKTHSEVECCYYSWIQDYLERLEAKDEYRKFQEHHDQAHEYYVLVASLLV